MRALSGFFASTANFGDQGSFPDRTPAQQPRKRARLCPRAEPNGAAVHTQTLEHEPLHLVALEGGKEPGSPGQLSSPSKTTGLSRALVSGGVHATARFDLPSPAKAVRNLVEQAQVAHLCTTMSNMHHRRADYPFGTIVDFAVDGAGVPIFCLSPLAIHARNIIEDPRCSMVVQMPGWTDLANAHITIFGDVYQLPPEMQSAARDVFLAKQSSDKPDRWVSANASFFRMHRILDIFFVGGFGTVQWVTPAEYAKERPDSVVADRPHATLQALNEQLAERLQQQMSRPDAPVDQAAFISVDRTGADVRLRRSGEICVQRLGFLKPVHNMEEALAAAQSLLGT